MASVIPVHSSDDPRLVPYTRLTDAEHRRTIEGTDGTFVIEGLTAIRRALSSPYELRSLLLTASKADALATELSGRTLDIYVADQQLMNDVAGFDIHRGAIAVATRPPLQATSDVLGAARAVAVLEGLNDHENLGAVARTAAALGIDGLLLDPTCVDPLYRRCVRVSMGEILHLPYARLTPWPAALGELRTAGFVVVALTPVPSAESIDDVARSLGGPRSARSVGRGRVAVMLGAEGHGLSAGALAAADRVARIPMRTGVDSLNVGHAAAIAFHLLR